MNAEETDTEFDRYLSDTLKSKVKSTDELVVENAHLLSERADDENVIPFLVLTKRRVVVLGVAASIGLAVLFLPELLRKPNMVQIVATNIVLDQKIYRSEGEAGKLQHHIEGRQRALQELYSREARHLSGKINWMATYHVIGTDTGVDVDVVISATDNLDYLFRLRRNYKDVETFKAELITLEIEIVSILLDDTRELTL